MKTKEVSQILHKILAQELLNYGFSFSSRLNRFERNTGNALQIFVLLFTKKSPGTYVEPVLRIKIYEIEKIFHQASLKSPKYWDSTTTLGNNLFKLKGYMETGNSTDTDEKKRYLIENNEDIKNTASAVIRLFKEYAIKYFDCNSTISRADYLLNIEPRKISVHNWLYPVRACMGLLAAKLNNSSAFEKLCEIYSEELEGANEAYRADFVRLKDMLRGHLSN